MAIVLTVGCLWGAINLLQIARGKSFLQLRLLSSIHAHVHAMIFGWVGMFVMGFAYAEFASAAEQGFRSAGWKGALTKGIEIRQTQREFGYSYAYNIAAMYADSGDSERALRWLNAAYREHDWRLVFVNTDSLFDPIRSNSRFGELYTNSGCRGSKGYPGFSHRMAPAQRFIPV